MVKLNTKSETLSLIGVKALPRWPASNEPFVAHWFVLSQLFIDLNVIVRNVTFVTLTFAMRLDACVIEQYSKALIGHY